MLLSTEQLVNSIYSHIVLSREIVTSSNRSTIRSQQLIECEWNRKEKYEFLDIVISAVIVFWGELWSIQLNVHMSVCLFHAIFILIEMCASTLLDFPPSFFRLSGGGIVPEKFSVDRRNSHNVCCSKLHLRLLQFVVIIYCQIFLGQNKGNVTSASTNKNTHTTSRSFEWKRMKETSNYKRSSMNIVSKKHHSSIETGSEKKTTSEFFVHVRGSERERLSIE